MNFKSLYKKSLLVAVMCLPVIASASALISAGNTAVFVHNNTSLKSTLRVTSGFMAGYCVGDNLWSEPGESKEVSWNAINLLCYGKFPCTAEIFLGNDHDCGDSAKSRDVLVGTVSLSDHAFISITSVVSDHSLIGGQNNLTVNN